MNKFCDVCQTTKSTEDFFKSESNRTRCKACTKLYRIRNKKQMANSKQKSQLKKYGLLQVDYMTMLKVQNGLCKICSKPESAKGKFEVKILAVDHDHVTGKVRGLLCQRCNIALGLLKEDAKVMNSMINYLKEVA